MMRNHFGDSRGNQSDSSTSTDSNVVEELPNGVSPERDSTLAYVRQMAFELRRLSHGAGEHTLAYLLDMVAMQADEACSPESRFAVEQKRLAPKESEA